MLPTMSPGERRPSSPTRPTRPTASTIRLAGPPDVDAVASRVAEAVHPTAVAAWLIADPSRRSHVLREVIRMHVEQAQSAGWIWIVGDADGVAGWLPGGLAPPPGYDRRLAAAAASYAPRFRILDAARRLRRPPETHQYLGFLAVAAARRGRGIGSALLTWQHRVLDRGGMPAHVDATGVESRRMYLRNGYRDHGPPIDLPDGPRLWPMRREPAQHQPAQHREAPA
jgi:GNAT superfamily N-acetyltransferase